MKRIIDSTLVILSLMLIFGCKESKVGQGNPTKDSMSIDTDSVISGKVFNKQDIASEDTLNAVIRTQSPKSKDFDFEVFIMRGEKTVQIIPFSYPKDDTFDPNGGRKDSCLMADVTFDGNKDVLFYLGSFGASGTEHFDAYVWNPNTEHYDKIEEFKDIPNPKISDKYKCILSRVYVSSAENEYAKYVCTNGHLIKVAELRQYWKGNIYPERDRAVYEEHFIKANVWKRNLKLNQISDFWKPVVPF